MRRDIEKAIMELIKAEQYSGIEQQLAQYACSVDTSEMDAVRHAAEFLRSAAIALRVRRAHHAAEFAALLESRKYFVSHLPERSVDLVA